MKDQIYEWKLTNIDNELYCYCFTAIFPSIGYDPTDDLYTYVYKYIIGRLSGTSWFFCVGVMYSGEYDACEVTLSVYPHRASLKNMPDHGGNRTYDLWNTSPMLCQLSYAVWSVRVCDISERNLVPSISMLSNNNHDFFIFSPEISHTRTDQTA